MPQLYDPNRDTSQAESRRHSGLPAKPPSRLMVPASDRRTHYRRRKRRLIRPGFLVFGTAVLIAAVLIVSGHDPFGGLAGLPNILGNTSESVVPDSSVSDPSRDLPVDNNEGEITPPDWVTQDLLPVNEYSRPGDALPQVNGVVVHYVGNPGTTAEQNRSYYANLAETHETYASSHFLIGIDGTILQCVPLNEISYCSNDRNADTIAIECCHPDETGKFTPETTQSLIRLLNWLIDTYDLEQEDIIRHYDVTGKDCPRYFVRNPEEWEAFLNGLTFPAR